MANPQDIDCINAIELAFKETNNTGGVMICGAVSTIHSRGLKFFSIEHRDSFGSTLAYSTLNKEDSKIKTSNESIEKLGVYKALNYQYG